MSGQRIKAAVDHRTILHFIEAVCGLYEASARDTYPDTEKDAARLLIMLGSIGEFKVVTSASQVERLFVALSEAGMGDEHIFSTWETLAKAIEVIPDDASAVDEVCRADLDVPYGLRFLVASAKQVKANVVVSPLALQLKACPESVVSPTGFFAEIKRRYGFDYAELIL